MKLRHRLIAFAALVIGPMAGAQSAPDANWLGVWQAELEGRPGVTLTVVDDRGELAGTIVFDMVSRESGVISHDAHLLQKVSVAGDAMSFQIFRKSDGRMLHVTMKMTKAGLAQLRCTDCGAGSPVAQMVKQD